MRLGICILEQHSLLAQATAAFSDYTLLQSPDDLYFSVCSIAAKVSDLTHRTKILRAIENKIITTTFLSLWYVYISTVGVSSVCLKRAGFSRILPGKGILFGPHRQPLELNGMGTRVAVWVAPFMEADQCEGVGSWGGFFSCSSALWLQQPSLLP